MSAQHKTTPLADGLVSGNQVPHTLCGLGLTRLRGIRRHPLSLSVLLWILQKGTPSLPIMVCAGDKRSIDYGCMIIMISH